MPSFPLSSPIEGAPTGSDTQNDGWTFCLGGAIANRACGDAASSWLKVWRLWLCGDVGPWEEEDGGEGGGGIGGGVGQSSETCSQSRQRASLLSLVFPAVGGNQSRQQSWVDSVQWGGWEGTSIVCWQTKKTWGREKKSFSDCYHQYFHFKGKSFLLWQTYPKTSDLSNMSRFLKHNHRQL